MSEYTVTATCVVHARDPVAAAFEADKWFGTNNSVLTVTDGNTITNVDLSEHEEKDW